MHIQVSFDSLKQTKWYEYLVRFLFGGLVTAATGLITAIYGPVIGGLFLAIPSIFPATVSLVQSHQKEKDEQQGKSEEQGDESGKQAAGETAGGAVFGSIGLLGFALIVWKLSTQLTPWLVLLIAFLVWLTASMVVWRAFAGLTTRFFAMADRSTH